MMRRPADFYPRSPCGERPLCKTVPCGGQINFYPRSPCGERQDTPSISMPKPDFYPRSPCGERRYLINTYHRIFGISIHALLAESDCMSASLFCGVFLFLSTLSLRRATVNGDAQSSCFVNFYPRSPCGERQLQGFLLAQGHNFYPRSPCGERRLLACSVGSVC